MTGIQDPGRTQRDASYQAALEFLYGRLNFERLSVAAYTTADFKLGRIQMLLERLGNPQWQLPCVHITGTKGKGSTAAMTAAILQAAGQRIGLFTSPHIRRFEERLTVDRIEPSPAQVVALVDQLRPIVAGLDQIALRPTFFEITTAMAWLHFLDQKVDTVVLEVGLGGRLDATNQCRPDVCVLTSISRDHARLLGQTLPEIATEKAGIAKPNVPFLCGPVDDGSWAAIRRICDSPLTMPQEKSAPAPVYRVGFDAGAEIRLHGQKPLRNADGLCLAAFDLDTPWGHYHALESPLAGEHQMVNLALAVAACDVVHQRRRRSSAEKTQAVKSGLKTVTWPLRVETIARHPLVILDAAHNEASIAALCATVAEVPARTRWVIFGTSGDKEAEAMLNVLAAHFDRLILTRYIENPRALAIAELVQLSAGVVNRATVTTAETPAAAWELVRQGAAADDMICVTGSFFLAGEFRELLRGD